MQTYFSSWAVYTALWGQNFDVVHTTNIIKNIWSPVNGVVWPDSGIARSESIIGTVRHNFDYCTLFDY